jgi:hypothetical protein
MDHASGSLLLLEKCPQDISALGGKIGQLFFNSLEDLRLFFPEV